MLHTPDLDPDPDTTHPIILYNDLYAEDPRAPQTQFVLERQIAFLEALAVSGSVRAAARRVKVSHQTCYRARRGSAAFGRAWDAALVIARARVEEKLADHALNGVREEVWYHGELVGYRTRFSERLLLAHLGRLDRMRGEERIEALAEDFDAMLDRMRRGEGIEVEARAPAEAGASGGEAHHEEAPACAGEQPRVPAEAGTSGGSAQPREAPACAGAHEEADISLSGQCNRRSMSPQAIAPVCPECGGRCDDPRAIAQGLLGPQDCQWLENRLQRMERARPAGAATPVELVRARISDVGGEAGEGLPDAEAVEAAQLAAFEAGEEGWWLAGCDG